VLLAVDWREGHLAPLGDAGDSAKNFMTQISNRRGGENVRNEV
jgi:hypothetical protein